MISDPLLEQEWHIVARVEDVPADKPLAAELLGRKLVVWRASGRMAAWEDLCIHRGAKLSLGGVKNGCLACPYHGWTCDENGQCVLDSLSACFMSRFLRGPRRARTGRTARNEGLHVHSSSKKPALSLAQLPLPIAAMKSIHDFELEQKEFSAHAT